MNIGKSITAIHQFAESLGNAIDAKDPYTEKHSLEVAEISRILALSLGLGKKRADIIHIAGHLHDIGKIGVPDRILNKRGELNEDEWTAIRRHPQIGADILRPVREIAGAGICEIVLYHHERYDGRGYPRGLRGKAIPLGARIIAAADSLSAMTGCRSKPLTRLQMKLRYVPGPALILKLSGHCLTIRIKFNIFCFQSSEEKTMSADFQIESKTGKGNLHLRPRGDFDGSSALELINFISDRYDGRGKGLY